jgi:hypothetical protein
VSALTRGSAAIAAIGCLGLAAACSGAPTGPGVPPRPTASAQAPVAQVPGASWTMGRFVAYDSLAHGFSVPLPDDLGWRIEDGKDT